MLQKILHRFLLRRHFWRYASFSEIAELYASRSMTVFAIRFVMVFASVYFLKMGYTLLDISLIWVAYYLIKAVSAWPAAVIAARIGPKHGLLYANVLFAFGMVLLYGAERYGFIMLAFWCIVQAFAGTLNNLCYFVDFSKVKHVEHAGKEIGYMNIVEKVSAGLSPLIGGIIASLFGPIWGVMLAGLMFMLSAVPLMKTAEPTKTHQKLHFSGFPWRLTWQNFIAQTAIGYDFYASTTVWSLFIATIILPDDQNEIYAKLGALASLALVIALVSSYSFGKMIDRKEGSMLLKFSSIANSVVHLFRASVTSVFGVIGINITNEGATTGVNMAFNRGVFDTADRSGFRITYLSIMEAFNNLGAMVAAGLFAVIIVMFQSTDHMSFSIYFVATAIITILIMLPGFALYRKA